MGRKRHTPEQIITALREAEVGLARGKSVKLMSRELGITEQTYYRWSPRRSPRQPNRSIEELPLTFTHNSGLDPATETGSVVAQRWLVHPAQATA